MDVLTLKPSNKCVQKEMDESDCELGCLNFLECYVESN